MISDQLNELVSYVKAKAGVVHKFKTEIMVENRIKICVTCLYENISHFDDFGDYKFLGSSTSLNDNHEVFFQYRPI